MSDATEHNPLNAYERLINTPEPEVHRDADAALEPFRQVLRAKGFRRFGRPGPVAHGYAEQWARDAGAPVFLYVRTGNGAVLVCVPLAGDALDTLRTL